MGIAIDGPHANFLWKEAMAKSLNITGQKFNQLLAIRLDHKNNGRSHWLFRCDCGVEKVLDAPSVKHGQIKSCGCRKHRTHKCYSRTLPDGESALNSLYTAYQYSAKERGFIFLLTKEDFKELTKRDCTYCGSAPSQEHLPSTLKVPYVYNGIDRRNNEIGYVKDNVVPCCKSCNFAKHKMTTDEFLNWIKRLVFFQTREGSDLCSRKELTNVTISDNPI